ncbi:MAG: CvpA family protein [Flavobacteriaceae bacterium]|nr:CvpA family protein [Flavobacteriaceae bacterium]
MNILDVIVLCCLSYGLIRGLIKGFVVEIAVVVALFVGVLGAFKFASTFAFYIHSFVELNPKVVQGVSFLLLFIGIVYGISLLAKMLTKTLQIVALGLLNRLAGGLFGLVKWTVILSALTLALNQIESVISLVPETLKEESFSLPFLIEFGDFLFEWILQNNSLSEQKLI